MDGDAADGFPGFTTSYVGRGAEAAEVRSHVAAGRLVTLTGPGGVGKTRLATEVVPDLGRRLADGAVFVELAELHDGALVPNLVADRLGLLDRSGRPIGKVVLDHLRTMAILLILDNCDHLAAACADFATSVLAECPGVAILATSRQSLDVRGEYVLRVPSLAVPEEGAALPPAKLVGYDSVRLLVDRASAVEPSFTITSRNAEAIARLCRQLDGLPLAIELVAARFRSLSPQQISERLSRRVAVLPAGPSTAPERQQTLRATIDWTYHLCSDVEQAVWRRASVFAGSFDLEAAERVCAGPDVAREEVLDAIDGLLDKSVFLRSVPDGLEEVVRYRMLETLREYGVDLLDETGERAAAERAHRDWIDRLTATADAEWTSRDQLAWLARLRLEHANLRAALEWSLTEPGEAEAALRIASRLDEYWMLSRSNVEVEGCLVRALELTSPDLPGRPGALATAALHAVWHGDVSAAFARLEEAQNLAGPADDHLRAYGAYVRSLAAMVRFDSRATGYAKEAVAAFRAHGDVRREMASLFLYGVLVVFSEQDLETARVSLRRMLELSEACEECYYRGMAWFGIAVVETDIGDIEPAERAAQEGMAQARPISRVSPYHLEALAYVAERQGRHERAATIFGMSAKAFESFGVPPEVLIPYPHNKYRDQCVAALGTRRYNAAFSAGRAMTADEAVRFATGDTGPADRLEELTSREREIAALVTRGLSNRQIATTLTISHRTVDAHVQNILTKLGFHNRAQIAAWYTRQR